MGTFSTGYYHIIPWPPNPLYVQKKIVILLFYAKQVYNVVKIAATKENIMELFIVDALLHLSVSQHFS